MKVLSLSLETRWLSRVTMLIAVVILVATNTFAQRAGDLDRSFNYGKGLNYDFNYGSGSNVGTSISAIQPDGKIIIAGGFTSFNGVPNNGLVRLYVDGTIDTSFKSRIGVNSDISTLNLLPDGKILIGGRINNNVNTTTKYLLRLHSNGNIDTTFNVVYFNSVSSLAINNSTLKPDGKILVLYTGYPPNSSRFQYNIVQLNNDGSLDTSFNAGSGANSHINNIRCLPNDKIIISGEFTSFNGIFKSLIACLNADGSLDSTFNSGTGLRRNITNDSLYRGVVNTLAVQPDGKILIEGNFLYYKGVACKDIIRLHPNGNLDTSFNSSIRDIIFNSRIAIQARDGKILVYGAFSDTINNQIYFTNRLVRLNLNGSLDTSFITEPGDNNSGVVLGINIVLEDKILLTGYFYGFNNAPTNGIAMLNANGALNDTFYRSIGTGVGGSNKNVHSASLQSDGKIIIAGAFNSYNNTANNCIIRINRNGGLDSSFTSGISQGLFVDYERIYSTLIQPNGKIIIAGRFFNSNGTPLKGLARLNTNGSLDATFITGTFTDRYRDGFRIATLHTDNKVLIGGLTYNSFNDQFGVYILSRLNANGGLDNSFNAPSTDYYTNINAITIQPDNKILVGLRGGFRSINNIIIRGIARLNTNGSIDQNFNASMEEGSEINAIKILADNKIIMCGYMSFFFNSFSHRVVRLNTNGTLDERFNYGTGANDKISAIVIQPDGKIIIAGKFTSYDGIPVKQLARLNADGTLDNTFTSQVSIVTDITTMVEQGDGKLIIGGDGFFSYNNLSTPGIARIHGYNCLSINTPFITVNNTSIGADSSVVTVTNIIPNATYLWTNGQIGSSIAIKRTDTVQVRAIIDGCYSDYSAPNITSITGKRTANHFELFPNPANNKVTIRTNGIGTLEIVNVVGQVVLTQVASETNEINVSKLAKGVYSVRFNGASKMLVVQ